MGQSRNDGAMARHTRYPVPGTVFRVTTASGPRFIQFCLDHVSIGGTLIRSLGTVSDADAPTHWFAWFNVHFHDQRAEIERLHVAPVPPDSQTVPTMKRVPTIVRGHVVCGPGIAEGDRWWPVDDLSEEQHLLSDDHAIKLSELRRRLGNDWHASDLRELHIPALTSAEYEALGYQQRVAIVPRWCRATVVHFLGLGAVSLRDRFLPRIAKLGFHWRVFFGDIADGAVVVAAWRPDPEREHPQDREVLQAAAAAMAGVRYLYDEPVSDQREDDLVYFDDEDVGRLADPELAWRRASAL